MMMCHNQTTVDRLAYAAADYRLRCEGALALLNMGLVHAARQVLVGAYWPTVRQACNPRARLPWVGFDQSAWAALAVLIKERGEEP